MPASPQLLDTGYRITAPPIVDEQWRPRDLAAATLAEVLATRPSGASTTWPGTVAADGIVFCLTPADALDEPGTWRIQSHVVLPGGREFHSAIGTMEVRTNLRGGADVGTGRSMHGARHAAGGTDPLRAVDLSSEGLPAGRIIESDGNGGFRAILTPGGGLAGVVVSAFGRRGEVVAEDGDYSASQVSNDSGTPGADVGAALDGLEARKANAADVTPLATAVASLESGKADATTVAALETSKADAAHTHPEATDAAAGLMPASDKAKLDSININRLGATIRGFVGFSTSDYLAAAGAAPGSAAFSAVWYGVLGAPRMDAGAFLVGRKNTSAGWSLSLGGRSFGNAQGPAYLSASVRDGGGTERTIVAELNPNSGIFSRPAHIAMTYGAGGLQLYINGALGRFFPAEGIVPGMTAAPTEVPFTLGLDPNAYNEPAEHSLLAGAGYVEAQLSPATVLAHFRACENAGRAFVVGAEAWMHRYDASNPGAGAPGTVEDLGSGGVDATRAGAALAVARWSV